MKSESRDPNQEIEKDERAERKDWATSSNQDQTWQRKQEDRSERP